MSNINHLSDIRERWEINHSNVEIGTHHKDGLATAINKYDQDVAVLLAITDEAVALLKEHQEAHGTATKHGDPDAVIVHVSEAESQRWRERRDAVVSGTSLTLRDLPGETS